MPKHDASTAKTFNPRSLWRRFLWLVPPAVFLTLASILYSKLAGGTYTFRTEPLQNRNVRIEDLAFENSEVAEVVSLRQDPDGRAHVEFRARGEGRTRMWFADTPDAELWNVDVRGGTLFVDDFDFSGWIVVYLSICVFLAVCAGMFASVMFKLWRHAWYGYEMVASGGGLLFFLTQHLNFTFLGLTHDYGGFNQLASAVVSMAQWFVMASIGPIGLLALLVSISNIALVRREGFRPVNLLGIATSVLWALVIVAWFLLGKAFSDTLGFAGSTVVGVLLSSAIAFGEALLVSVIVCGWLASRHVPAHGVDYLIVLGCGLRADGTPSPLLAGRVDAAYKFDEKRAGAGDAPSTFVPSGGQGPDEVVSEAQSMGAYLERAGVAPERIVLENRSTTTRENMRYSREVIEKHAARDAEQLRIGFSTTNYHVLRGYVCAHEAGMAVEGIGSKTRIYFWPNAFLREFVGLLAAQWKMVLLVYCVIAAVYCAAAYILVT